MALTFLSEWVVLRVLLLLVDWAFAKSSNSLDHRIFNEIRTKLKADGKLSWTSRIRLRTFIAACGVVMIDMITPNFSRAEMSFSWSCGMDLMDSDFMKMSSNFETSLGLSWGIQECTARIIVPSPEGIRGQHISSQKEPTSRSSGWELLPWSKKLSRSVSPWSVSLKKAKGFQVHSPGHSFPKRFMELLKPSFL